MKQHHFLTLIFSFSATPIVTADSFRGRAIADPDRPLLETKWEANGLFDPTVESSWSAANPPWIQLLPSGSLSLFLCGYYEGTYTISEMTVVFTSISPVELSPCESDEKLEFVLQFRKHFKPEAVLTYEIAGSNLIIQDENGVGVRFRASNEDPASGNHTLQATGSPLGPTQPPTVPAECAIQLGNTDLACAQLLNFTATVCDCYNFCSGQLIACLGYGERSSFSCSGEAVLGCTSAQKIAFEDTYPIYDQSSSEEEEDSADPIFSVEEDSADPNFLVNEDSAEEP